MDLATTRSPILHFLPGIYLARLSCITLLISHLSRQIHIPASLLCDLQGFYPSWLTSPPSPLHTIQSFYLEMSRDPIVSGALGLNGDLSNWTWIRTFFVVEACVSNLCSLLMASKLFAID